MVRSYAPGFIFVSFELSAPSTSTLTCFPLTKTTSLPPSNAAGARAAVAYQREHLGDRQQQQRNVASVKAKFASIGIPVIPNPSHIVPLFVGSAEQAKAASDLLLVKHKLYVQSINFPTVAIGSERLRITPSPLHTEAQLDELVQAVNDVWLELGLKRSDELVGRKELTGKPVNLWTAEQLALEDKGEFQLSRLCRYIADSSDSTTVFPPLDSAVAFPDVKASSPVLNA